MESVEKATSVVMQKCNDGLRLIFSNETATTTVTMDWVQAARMTMQLDAQGTEAHTMMQMGLDPYRSSHRQSFDLSWLQAAGQK
jgi:hypothetical protein